MRAIVLAAILAWAGLALPAAHAQQGGGGGDEIQDIRVEGTQRIEPETVRAYMRLAPGDAFSSQRLDRSLKALFATGLFADVTLAREGDVLVVRVVENPIINRLAFEGNKRIEDDELVKEVRLRPRVVFTRSRVQADVKRILEVYRRSGRFAAAVTPKVIQLPQNRVDLVFEIDEGPLTEISAIHFIGNRKFSDSSLREEIRTKESAWYRFFTTDDTYDPDRIGFDRELLRRFYLSEGYADFRTVSAVAELTPSRESFVVTFTVEEGERYRVGTVDLATQLPDLDVESLRALIVPETGEWYDAEELDETVDALTDAVGVLGFAFVDIRPRVKRNREARTIDVTFDIREGPRVFVERIEVTGNVRTLDKVVRREVRLVEGDAFNSAKLRRSRERIDNLGFFEKVNIKNVAGSAPDRSVVQIEVEEKSTGELSFGVGFSTTQGPLAQVGVVERNLLGKGQSLSANLTVSGRQSEVDLGFTEPYFLERDLAAGFDLFRRTKNRTSESSFRERSLGGNLRIGYQVIEHLRHKVNYGLRTTNIEDVGSDASIFIKAQEGTQITSLVGQELAYDKRNNRFDPTDGYILRLNNELAGLGGNVRFLRSLVGAAYYYSVLPQWVVGVQGEAGYVFGIADDVNIADRFFLGGDDLRGFDVAGVGPRDGATNDALGGNQLYRGNVELSFPIGLPNEFGISGKLFTDFGSLTELDSSGSGILDTGSLRATVGIGLGWRSPFGPMRVDYAKPYLKESHDKERAFRFSFGTNF